MKTIILLILFATINFGQNIPDKLLLGLYNSRFEHAAELMPSGYAFLKDANGRIIKDANDKYIAVFSLPDGYSLLYDINGKKLKDVLGFYLIVPTISYWSIDIKLNGILNEKYYYNYSPFYNKS